MTELSGLTEAIEAALLAVSTADTPIGEVARGANAVRAAAPILVRAALRQAADDLNVIVSERGTLLWFIEGESRLESVAGWLRDRADSITEGTTP